LDYAKTRARPNPVRTFTETIPRLTPEEMERAYRSCGVLWKGINKRARDAFRKGFIVKPDGEDRELQVKLNGASREWMRTTAYKPKAIQALREMFVFGDGFLELAYDEKNARSEKEPDPRASITAVYNVDPFSILPVRDPETGNIKAYLTPSGPPDPVLVAPGQIPGLQRRTVDVRGLDRRAIQQWAAGKGNLPKGVTALHPKRIQHFQVNALREHPDGLGISIIEPAYINALAKLAGDHAAGDILEWYSKGFFVLTIDFATPDDLRKAQDTLDAAKNARKNYFVGSERSHFDIKSPAIANIKQFYDNFYIEIAAALEMPSMVATGAQKGTVSGSGADLEEYNDDVFAFQDLLLDAPMLEMMRRVLKRSDISLQWIPLYVNKQTEADIAMKRSQATASLYGARVLSRREAIRYLRDGELPDPDTVPDEYAEDVTLAPMPPAREDKSAEPEPVASEDPQDEEALSAAEQAQIEARRKLGQEILDSWENGS
jgi:hypothetical protein